MITDVNKAIDIQMQRIRRNSPGYAPAVKRWLKRNQDQKYLVPSITSIQAVFNLYDYCKKHNLPYRTDAKRGLQVFGRHFHTIGQANRFKGELCRARN